VTKVAVMTIAIQPNRKILIVVTHKNLEATLKIPIKNYSHQQIAKNKRNTSKKLKKKTFDDFMTLFQFSSDSSQIDSDDDKKKKETPKHKKKLIFPISNLGKRKQT
jgi:hypothetical protein